MLYNYLSNALKFSPPDGAVLVRAMPAGHTHFRIEIIDHGEGIAMRDQAHLFVAFHQLEGGLAKRHGATGLGLALTKRFVEAQGGEVGVKSMPGYGSTFYAVLPLRTALTSDRPALCASAQRTRRITSE